MKSIKLFVATLMLTATLITLVPKSASAATGWTQLSRTTWPSSASGTTYISACAKSMDSIYGPLWLVKFKYENYGDAKYAHARTYRNNDTNNLIHNLHAPLPANSVTVVLAVYESRILDDKVIANINYNSSNPSAVPVSSTGPRDGDTLLTCPN